MKMDIPRKRDGRNMMDVFIVMRHLASYQMWGTLFWHLVNVVDCSFMEILHHRSVLAFSSNNLFVVQSSLLDFERMTRDYLRKCANTIVTLGFYTVTPKDGCLDQAPKLMALSGSSAGFAGVVWPLGAGDKLMDHVAWIEGIPLGQTIPAEWVEDERFKGISLGELFKKHMPETMARRLFPVKASDKENVA